MIGKYSSLDWSPELKGDLVQPLQSFSWRWRFQPHIKPVEEDGQDRVQLEVEEAGKSIWSVCEVIRRVEGNAYCIPMQMRLPLQEIIVWVGIIKIVFQQ